MFGWTWAALLFPTLLWAIRPGKLIRAESATSGIYKLEGCTASAISDRLLITAAHCGIRRELVGDSVKRRVRERVCITPLTASDPSLCSSTIKVNPPWWENQAARFDLAIVEFPTNSFPAFYSIAETEVPPGGEFLVAGASSFQHNERGIYWDLIPTILVGRAGHWFSEATDREGAIVDEGDSGGPLISKDCQLAGITSAGGMDLIERKQINVFAPTGQVDNRKFIDSLRPRSSGTIRKCSF